MPELRDIIATADLPPADASPFVGDPSTFTPAGPDLLYTRTDVTPNQLYRSTGTTPGALVKVGASQDGVAGTISINTVESGFPADVTNIGTATHAVLNITLPTGSQIDGVIQLPTITTPSIPDDGFLKVYAKADDSVYVLLSNGAEREIGNTNFSQIATFNGEVLVDPLSGNVVTVGG